ncbi:MAG: ABC transporter ATP-binding protein [Geminicoccaceae bacterium]
MTAASLDLDGVSRRYGEVEALAPVHLAVPSGSYAVILGPSGSGKTTLLSVLGGFVAPTAGRVRIGGADVTALPPAKRPTITVFQDYALFPHLKVATNVGFGLRMRGVAAGERRRREGEALRLVGLDGMGERAIQALSGGQRQRVALARALVLEPSVLLLDEPLGALDQELRRQMQIELKTIQRRVAATFVHVTHDQEEALALADLLVVMRAGRIEDQGPPDRVYLRPATRFVATFLGDGNLIEGTAAGRSVDTVFGRVGIAAPDGPATLLVRPEHFHATADEPTWTLGKGSVASAAFLGSHWRCLVQSETAEMQLVVHLPPYPAPAVGSRIDLAVPLAAVAIISGG